MTSKGTNSSGGVYHDTLKFWVARIAKDLGYQSVEMEARGEATGNKFIPDVVMRHFKKPKNSKIKRKPRMYVEVQDKLTHTWMDKIEKNYSKDELIIIDIDDFILDYGEHSSLFVCLGVYTALQARIALETPEAPPKEDKPYKAPKQADTHMIEYRGHHIKNKFESKRRVDYIENRKERRE